jgi:hypothetical protein
LGDIRDATVKQVHRTGLAINIQALDVTRNIRNAPDAGGQIEQVRTLQRRREGGLVTEGVRGRSKEGPRAEKEKGWDGFTSEDIVRRSLSKHSTYVNRKPGTGGSAAMIHEKCD